MRRSCSILALLTGCWALSSSAQAQFGFFPVGDIPGGQSFSRCWGISGDGTVITGTSVSDLSCSDGFTGCGEAFKWTFGGGLQRLGFTPGASSTVGFGVNHSGSNIVGTAIVPGTGFTGFRWTSAGMGTVNLGLNTQLFDVEGGGAAPTAVGQAVLSGVTTGVATTSGPFTVIVPDLAGGLAFSRVNSMTTGGLYVGESNSTNGWEGFRYSAQAGGASIGLGDLPGGEFDSGARGVSPDGSVIVGWGTTAAGRRAMRIVNNGAMQDMGPGQAYAASRNGLVIVGQGATGAAVWFGGSPFDLKTYLQNNGVSNLTGWTLDVATGVSDSGEVICGYGTNPSGNVEGFVVTIGPRNPADICENAPPYVLIGGTFVFDLGPMGNEGQVGTSCVAIPPFFTVDTYFRLVPDCTGPYTVRVDGTTAFPAPNLQIFDRCPTSGGAVELGCAIAGGPGNPALLTRTLTGGQTYFIRIANRAETPPADGRFTMSVQRTAAPGNNVCSEATAIGTGSVRGTTLNAGVEVGTSCGGFAASGDIWYAFTPSFTGQMSLDTAGSGVPTLLEVYTSCGSAPLPFSCTNRCFLDFSYACLTNTLVSDSQTYFIRVATSTPGCVQLNVWLIASNDQCTGFIPSLGVGSSLRGTIAGTNNEGGTTCNGFNIPTGDVWYTFTPTCSGVYPIRVTGDDFPANVAALTNCPTFGGFQLGCAQANGPGQAGELLLNATANTTYRLKVAGNSPGSTFTLRAFRRTDRDRSGSVGSLDLTAYVNAWFADVANGTQSSEFDGVPGVGSGDLTAFLSAWFADLGGTC